jgi:hypothetical protein
VTRGVAATLMAAPSFVTDRSSHVSADQSGTHECSSSGAHQRDYANPAVLVTTRARERARSGARPLPHPFLPSSVRLPDANNATRGSRADASQRTFRCGRAYPYRVPRPGSGRHLHLREPRRRILPAVRARFYRALLIPPPPPSSLFGAARRGMARRLHIVPIRGTKLQSRVEPRDLTLHRDRSLFEGYDAMTR